MSHEIQIGQILDKRFEITALVEHTGMGTVFKALDRYTSQIVALKVPHPNFDGTAQNSARFAREASIISSLDHPGILKIVPVPEKSRTYIVMEYLEGETLHDILERTRPIPVTDALRLGSQVCEILDYLHRHGVVHCDLKPANIMLSDDGAPHIIDFGIARGLAMSGWHLPLTGTLEYMAPEQIQRDRVDARTDIYSFGLVLYEMVTGTHPFRGHIDIDDLSARLEVQPRPPSELNSNVTEQIEEIILHAMAPNPADRYVSAAAMKAELDFPERVQMTGMYRNPRKASLWPKRLRLAGVILSLAATPFILFYIFLLVFQRQLGR